MSKKKSELDKFKVYYEYLESLSPLERLILAMQSKRNADRKTL